MKLIVSLFFLFTATAVFAQNPTEPTEELALLRVIVVDEAGEPGPGNIISFLGKESQETWSGTTGPDGKFSILVPEGDTYEVKYKTFDEDQDYTELEIPVVDGYVDFEFEVIVELPKVITLKNVYFDTGKSILKPESYPSLNNLATLLSARSTMVIEVGGHTDSQGDDAANMKLSDARANSVRSYLIEQGVSAERLKAKGYGETKPLTTNDTAEGRAKNRRTEVTILQE